MTLDVGLPRETRIPGPYDFAVSPDGGYLAFCLIDAKGKTLLWVRNLSTGETRSINGTDGASDPFWSPDSRHIAYSALGSLHRVGLEGNKQTIAKGPGLIRGAWNEDGSMLMGTMNIQVVPATGGEARVLYTPDQKAKENGVGSVELLPGGKRFLFHIFGERAGTAIGSIDGRERRFLYGNVNSSSMYVPSTTEDKGYLLYIRQGQLLAHRFDAEAGLPLGEPVSVASGMGAGKSFSCSKNGVLVLRKEEGRDRQLTWYDRSGKLAGKLSDLARWGGMRISPEGARLITSLRDNALNFRLQLYALSSGASQRFSFGPGTDADPVWFPSGREIAFRRYEPGRHAVVSKDASGAGAEKILYRGDRLAAPTSISPDGRWLIINVISDGADISLIPLTGEPKPVPFLSSPAGESEGIVSPDGRWIAYQSNETGSNQIFIQPIPEVMGGPKDRGKWQISNEGGGSVRWRKDSQELFYGQPDGKIMSVDITVNGNALQASQPKALFTPLGSAPFFEVTPDGQRFLVAEPEKNSAPPFTVILNWEASLKR